MNRVQLGEGSVMLGCVGGWWGCPDHFCQLIDIIFLVALGG